MNIQLNLLNYKVEALEAHSMKAQCCPTWED